MGGGERHRGDAAQLRRHPQLLPTVNFGIIAGGKAINQIPDLCTLSLDIRYIPEDKPADLIQRLRQHAPELEVLSTREDAPVNTDPQHPFVRALAQTIEHVTGTPAAYLAKHEASDAKHLARLGIPAIVFGPLGAGNHGANEWVSIESLMQYHTILSAFIAALP